MDTWPRGQYIRWLRVTEKYILIFIGTEEYNPLHSSALRSSIVSSDNRRIYHIFLGYTTKFIGCNWQIFCGFLYCMGNLCALFISVSFNLNQ
jgi:hypothetical protein